MTSEIEQRSEFRTGTLSKMFYYILYPLVLWGVGSLAAALLLALILSLPTFYKELFDFCLMGFICMILLISFPVLIRNKKIFHQMQLIVRPDSIKISKMVTPWKIIWFRFPWGKVSFFVSTPGKNIAIIDDRGRLHEVILLTDSKHNRKEQEKMIGILKDAGVRRLSEKAFIEMFKQGMIEF